MIETAAGRHIIHPFEGVDDVRFGMTPAEVAAGAGAPDALKHDPILELTVERRGAAEYEYDDDTGTLSAVCIFRPGRGRAVREQLDGSPYVPAFLDDVEILDPDGFAALRGRWRHREGRARTGVIFPQIALVVAGFGKRLPEGRYAIAFPCDRTDFYDGMIVV